MDRQTTNSKYVIWLYNINAKEFIILKSLFPSEHFDILDIQNDRVELNSMRNIKLLDKPDVLICDIDTNIDSEIRDLLYDSCCGLAMVSTKPFKASVGNTFELSDELVSVPVKKYGKFVEETFTKSQEAIKKIVDICQFSNIEKLQKLITRDANHFIGKVDFDKELHSGKSTNQITKEYLFKIARTINSYISLKDHYTAGHCERVAMYSEALAIALGMSNEQVEDVILAANLHDIGKIALPDAVITKTSKLNDFEFDLMKKHVELGTSILPSEMFNGIKASIRGHHEKYDGSGYPDGLAGEDIPLVAQILAIADSFDAMTSQRTYNKVKTPEEAFQDLMLHTKPYGVDGGLGVHYNPKLVQLFVKVISNSKTIMNYLHNQNTKIIDDIEDKHEHQYVRGGNIGE